MRILSVTWNIYDERLKEYAKNCTGGGLVIKNICEYIGRIAESYLFIAQKPFPALELGNIHIVKTNQEHASSADFNEKKEYLNYMSKMFEQVVEDIHPDVINFHGYGDCAFLCIDICRERRWTYCVTEHLYVGKQPIFNGYVQHVMWQNHLYQIPDLDIVAVSNGMKKRILSDFPMIDEQKIKVITNGTNFKKETICDEKLRNELMCTDRKILLCVGTLLERKNQMQLVDVFSESAFLRENVKVIFCGQDGLNGELQKKIEEYQLNACMSYAGALSSNDMKKYYSLADGLVMPSYSEGLSIAALEAIACGLPVIMFSDSECADDLNDENVVCFADGRSDEDLEHAIIRWYEKEWDNKYIQNYSKNFTMERMAQDYLDYYTKLINK